MKKLAISLLLLAGCATQARVAPAPCNAHLAFLNSVLWIQSSAEYRATATQTYNSARRTLDAGLATSSGRPPAVILDVDETVVDNMAFEAIMIRQGKVFDAAEYAKWINEARAGATPGAADFLAYARSRGVTPFYITNRKAEEEAGTRANLERLGYPLDAGEDTLLVRGERPEWASGDKTARREFVASRYRVLAVLGDDLNDFVKAQELSREEREALVATNAHRWGSEWLILPNPVYGSWESAATGKVKDECEGLQKKLQALKP
jgi:5'-nucleotidase (lipoprotein e(P4) family)